MMVLRDKSAGTAFLSRALPTRDTGAVNADNPRDIAGSAKFGNDVLSRVHASYSSDNRYVCNTFVAILATDIRSAQRYKFLCLR